MTDSTTIEFSDTRAIDLTSFDHGTIDLTLKVYGEKRGVLALDREDVVKLIAGLQDAIKPKTYSRTVTDDSSGLWTVESYNSTYDAGATLSVAPNNGPFISIEVINELIEALTEARDVAIHNRDLKDNA